SRFQASNFDFEVLARAICGNRRNSTRRKLARIRGELDLAVDVSGKAGSRAHEKAPESAQWIYSSFAEQALKTRIETINRIGGAFYDAFEIPDQAVGTE